MSQRITTKSRYTLSQKDGIILLKMNHHCCRLIYDLSRLILLIIICMKYAIVDVLILLIVIPFHVACRMVLNMYFSAKIILLPHTEGGQRVLLSTWTDIHTTVKLSVDLIEQMIMHVRCDPNLNQQPARSSTFFNHNTPHVTKKARATSKTSSSSFCSIVLLPTIQKHSTHNF